ncbi:MAG: AsmA family protein, partial [Nitrospirae bacterium CG06_land_8_20_14_3_00_70_43]
AGSDRDALVASLGGDGQFAIQNGALAGVDLGQILRDAAALLHGRPAAARGAGDKTDFSEVTGTFQAANGVVRNRDLAGKAPAVRFRGAGEASLVAEHLDYLLTATVVESRTGQGGKEAAELKGVEIPIRISGPFATPEVHPDLRAALKGQAGKVVGQRVEKEVQKRLKDKVPEQLQHDLQDSLKGLFR